MPARTIADQIREFLGEQPDDCLAVNQARLAAALKLSGPVVHRLKVVSLKGDAIDVEGRPFDRVPAVTVHDEATGEEHTSPERDPTDEELAKLWKLPAASALPLDGPKAPAPTTTPAPAPAPPVSDPAR